MNIELDGQTINVTVKRGRALKTVDLEFRARNELIVTLPTEAEANINALLEKHRSLLLKKYREYLRRKRILDGDKILFQGKPYRIKFEAAKETQENRVVLEGDSITVQTTDNENPQAILGEWIAAHTEQLIRKTIVEYSSRFEKKPNRIFIQETRRWGYCTGRGDLTFNWQLSTLPEDLADYVVLHEMTHLTSLDHQRNFHKTISEFYPDYREKERELENYLAIKPTFQFKTRKLQDH